MSNIASDNFDSLTATTDLNGRTASGGGTWTATAGAFVGATGGGKVTSNSVSRAQATHSATPGTADYTVSADITVTSSGKTSLGVMARYQDASNHFWGIWLGGTWAIYKRVGGTDTRIDADGAATPVPTSVVNIVLSVSGSHTGPIQLTLKSGATTLATATSSDAGLDAAGSAGIKDNFSDAANSSTFDNWSADTIASASLVVPPMAMHYMMMRH